MEGFRRIKILRSAGSAKRGCMADLKELLLPSERVASQLLKRKMLGSRVGNLYNLFGAIESPYNPKG